MLIRRQVVVMDVKTLYPASDSFQRFCTAFVRKICVPEIPDAASAFSESIYETYLRVGIA